jgi:hypothetical protein
MLDCCRACGRNGWYVRARFWVAGKSGAEWSCNWGWIAAEHPRHPYLFHVYGLHYGTIAAQLAPAMVMSGGCLSGCVRGCMHCGCLVSQPHHICGRGGQQSRSQLMAERRLHEHPTYSGPRARVSNRGYRRSDNREHQCTSCVATR